MHNSVQNSLYILYTVYLQFSMNNVCPQTIVFSNSNPFIFLSNAGYFHIFIPHKFLQSKNTSVVEGFNTCGFMRPMNTDVFIFRKYKTKESLVLTLIQHLTAYKSQGLLGGPYMFQDCWCTTYIPIWVQFSSFNLYFKDIHSPTSHNIIPYQLQTLFPSPRVQ